MTTTNGPTEGPARKGHHWITLTVQTNGATVTERIEVTNDFRMQPANRPATEQPAHPRTTSNPNHAAWKAMDARTSYQTGCAWHECPNCDSTTGLRRFYSDRHEECWECGWKGKAPAPKATKTAGIKNGAAHTVQPMIDRKGLLTRYLEQQARKAMEAAQ